MGEKHEKTRSYCVSLIHKWNTKKYPRSQFNGKLAKVGKEAVKEEEEAVAVAAAKSVTAVKVLQCTNTL